MYLAIDSRGTKETHTLVLILTKAQIYSHSSFEEIEFKLAT